MHSFGYIHSDIKLDNIFVEFKDPKTAKHGYEFVVGGFDSVTPTGSVCELKCGTPMYAPYKRHHYDKVEEYDDWYAFHSVKKFMVDAVKGKLEDFDDIGVKCARPWGSTPCPAEYHQCK